MSKAHKSLYEHKTLGHILALAFFVLLGLGFFVAASQMNYVWKWTGVGKYFVYEKKSSIEVPFDGRVKIQNNTLILQGLEQNQQYKLENGLKASAKDGEEVYEGDELLSSSSYEAGPLVNGLIVTAKVSLFAALLAYIIGAIIAFMKISKVVFLKDIASVYVSIVRGTPLLVQIFIFYFIIATIFGMDRFLAGALSLGIFCGAYIAEVLRGAIQSIDKGQVEAAKSLGMNYAQTMVLIVMPQALKRALPALVGEMIALIKDSSLVSVISITDLTKAGREVVANTFAPFETWIVVALMYLGITFLLSIVGHRVEKRMQSKGGLS